MSSAYPEMDKRITPEHWLKGITMPDIHGVKLIAEQICRNPVDHKGKFDVKNLRTVR